MTWQDRRNAVLEGTARAAEMHEELSFRTRLGDGKGPIDVFRVIMETDVGLLFRPLDKLLGAFLPSPVRGILVTTQRDLYVQRYTAAHELGHFLMGHEASLDDERLISLATREQPHGDLQEIAADAFASEFLMPRWLVAAQVRRQRWTADALRTPGIVYQLWDGSLPLSRNGQFDNV
ncbi:MAG: ImmA/IrrE family metallo-endopeptidase, partial [Bryobacterales bacterium]|nr:ImmA/IrrE family metallo-endopeptidase [Bryobacterales bacterium]